MVTLCNQLILNPTGRDAHDRFILSLRELFESLRAIQDLLEGGEEEKWSMDQNPSYVQVRMKPREPPLPPATSTPVPASSTANATRLGDAVLGSKHERVKRRLMGAPAPYIGSLGASTKAGRQGALERTRKKRVPRSTASQVSMTNMHYIQ